MNCIPCSAVKSVFTDENSSLSKVCANWRAVPAVAVTATLIVALVAAISWGNTPLGVTFGVGTVFSGYLLYLAYQYRHLQSLEKSTQLLETQNGEFKTALDSFRDLLGNFDSSQGNLNTSLSTLTERLGELQAQGGLIKEAAAKLAELLKSVNTEEQNKILGRLEGQQEALKENVSTLKGLNEEFARQLGDLQKLPQVQKMLEQMGTLVTQLEQATGKNGA